MKKFFFSLVAAIVAVTATFAQSSTLATLSHDGEITTYYGVLALRQAHQAASNGDVITLSSGSFNAVDITKGVTIRGAGMGIDKTAQTEPTVITGDFKINIPDSVTARLTLEGIYSNHTVTVYGTFKNGTFLKDRFYKIYYENQNTRITNLTMIHCKVANELRNANSSSISCVNCVVNGVDVYNTTSNFEFLNCVVRNSLFAQDYIGTSSFKNCVLIVYHNNNLYTSLSSSAVAYNCVGIRQNTTYDLFYNVPNTTNVHKNFNEVFKTYAGTYNDDESFELTDEAKTKFIGIEGSEIGIYGGNMPFSTTPTNPQITKCNVAAKSTADGKLSVDITVNGAE